MFFYYCNSQLELLNTVIFAEHNGKTKLTLRGVILRSSPKVQEALAWGCGLEPKPGLSRSIPGETFKWNKNKM